MSSAGDGGDGVAADEVVLEITDASSLSTTSTPPPPPIPVSALDGPLPSPTVAVRADRSRLIESSSYFRALLGGSFSESGSGYVHISCTDEDSRIHSYGKTRKDSLMHLDLGFKFHALTKSVDGVLGQTYRSDYVSKVNVTAKMPIMGGAPKYLSTGLFSTDCAVSQFHRSDPATMEAFTS